MSRKLLVLSIVTLLGVILDQVTKWWVRVDAGVNAPGGLKVIPGFFSIVHAENPGAAFGMLGNLDPMWRVGIFVVFAGIALYIVWDMYRKLPPSDWFLAGTLGLILSGAFGNIIDRLYKPLFGVPNHRGELEYDPTVTDFLRFYTEHPEWSEWLRSMFGTAEYPSFNVADINLVVGVGFFLIHYLFFEGRGGEESAEQESEAPGEETLESQAQDAPDGEALDEEAPGEEATGGEVPGEEALAPPSPEEEAATPAPKRHHETPGELEDTSDEIEDPSDEPTDG